jgi:GNAT superfamily N-acetyltransferase
MRLKKIIQNEESAIILAETDQGPLGFAEIHIRQDEPSPHTVSYQYGFLQSLMVTRGHRRKGIGARLIKTTEQWAKERGAYEIRLDIWEFGEGPFPFYELMDYRRLKRTMIHQIGGEHWE